MKLICERSKVSIKPKRQTLHTLQKQQGSKNKSATQKDDLIKWIIKTAFAHETPEYREKALLVVLGDYRNREVLQKENFTLNEETGKLQNLKLTELMAQHDCGSRYDKAFAFPVKKAVSGATLSDLVVEDTNSKELMNGKTLQETFNVVGQLITQHDESTRELGMARLVEFINNMDSITFASAARIWKIIVAGLYNTDGLALQQRTAARSAMILSYAKTAEEFECLLSSFWRIIIERLETIDQYRLIKYKILMRAVIAESIEIIRKHLDEETYAVRFIRSMMHGSPIATSVSDEYTQAFGSFALRSCPILAHEIVSYVWDDLAESIKELFNLSTELTEIPDIINSWKSGTDFSPNTQTLREQELYSAQNFCSIILIPIYKYIVTLTKEEAEDLGKQMGERAPYVILEAAYVVFKTLDEETNSESIKIVRQYLRSSADFLREQFKEFIPLPLINAAQYCSANPIHLGILGKIHNAMLEYSPEVEKYPVKFSPSLDEPLRLVNPLTPEEIEAFFSRVIDNITERYPPMTEVMNEYYSETQEQEPENYESIDLSASADSTVTPIWEL